MKNKGQSLVEYIFILLFISGLIIYFVSYTVQVKHLYDGINAKLKYANSLINPVAGGRPPVVSPFN